MKTKTLITLMALMLALLGLSTGCKKSADQKVADANAIESQQDEADLSAVEQEWLKYKSDAETKIAEHEKIIADYRASMTGKDGKLQATYDKKIDDLDRKNLELKTKLNGFKNEGKTKWDQFKNLFDYDLNVVGNSLKGYGGSEKK